MNPSSKGKRTGWTGLCTLVNVLSGATTKFGPFKSAIDGFSKCVDIFEDEAEAQKDYEQLKHDMDSLFADLAGYLNGPTPPSMMTIIETLSKGIEKEAKLLFDRQQQSKLGRLAKSGENMDAVLECYRRINDLLARLALNVNITIWKTVDEQATDSRLRTLPYTSAARYRSSGSDSLGRNGCTPNTRVDVLQQIQSWVHDSTGPHIYWLNGMAGTGKTTIAYSLCEYLKQSGTLAASFFCTRQLPKCHDVNRILPSISYQMSLFSRPFRYAISQVLEQDPDAHDEPLAVQLDKLIAAPLREVERTLPVGLVVVFDALDECDDIDGVGRMLDALLKHALDVPVKFFVTSRPDSRILDCMQSKQAERVRLELRLHELDHVVVQHDIKTYLQSELGGHTSILSSDKIDNLTRRSGTLFIYAATIVRYIGYDNFAWSNDRLTAILNTSISQPSKSSREIDELYIAILDSVLEDKALEKTEKEVMILVLHTIICAKEPLSVNVLTGLLGLKSTKSVYAALRPLRSVLYSADTSERVTTLHHSFSDFMLCYGRSAKYYCDNSCHNAYLAQQCFDLLKVPNPPFNICRLPSSYLLDSEVPNIDNHIKGAVSEELWYACQYWVAHLSRLSGLSERLTDELSDLLSVRFLLWVEIMNLKHNAHEAVGLLHDLQAWMQEIEISIDLQHHVSDYRRFAASVASSPISKSTPHIYISGLPFWPSNRSLSLCYRPRFPKLVNARGPAMLRRETAPLFVLTTDSVVECVACSTDGGYITTGSADGRVCIWNALTGRAVSQVPVGCVGGVHSIAYSPDGSYVAYGSGDSTIRIWDVQVGQIAGRPLKGHTGPVNSVTYSPDGAYMASGSDDCTIRLWDADSRQAVGQPLRAHTGSVTSISYSPDSVYIVSGSHDCTIRRWDARSGEAVGFPFKGHGSIVSSVAYSPDGAYIVSGSHDCTVRIWNTNNREPVSQPLEGHTNLVNSVAYSPDGFYIASGSSDHSIRLWDARTGQAVGSLLKGHAYSVSSVAYLLDGSCIVSGSIDGTVCLWDTYVEPTVDELLDVHTTSAVTSVACSPNDALIVSGYRSGDVQTWDSRTGRMFQQLREVEVTLLSSFHGINLTGGRPIPVQPSHHLSDGAYVIFGQANPSIVIWSYAMNKIINIPIQSNGTYGFCSVAFSPDCLHIVFGFHNGGLCFRRSGSGHQSFKAVSNNELVGSLAYSPDGSSCIISDDLNTCEISRRLGFTSVYIWDTQNQVVLFQPPWTLLQPPHSVAWSPSNTHIAYSPGDGMICIRSLRTGKAVSQPSQAHTGWVLSVAYSPNGLYIVTGSADSTIRIWDAQTGEVVGEPLCGHTGLVNSVAYSSNGRYIISGSSDRTIRTWSACSRVYSQQEPQPPKGQAASYKHNVSNHSQISPATIDTNDLDEKESRGASGWVLDKDGWAVISGKRLLWIPNETRHAPLPPSNIAIIGTKEEWLGLDFTSAVLGEAWEQCYRPT